MEVFKNCIKKILLCKLRKKLLEDKLKKGYIFIIIGLILLGLGAGFYFYKSKDNKTSNNSKMNDFQYNSTRVSTNNEISDANEKQNINSTNTLNQEQQNKSSSSEQSDSPETPEPEKQTETQIADFTTKIYTKDSERQNNVSITCSTLNDTFVDDGATFSFCDTVGKATTNKGYKKADVFQDGEKVQALGGGNCQVSSTLYNAVLKVDSLKVTERHEHSNSVPYVSKGKDAAVAYGSYDFKFVNNSGNKIKISASCDNNYVYIKIFKIS